MGFSNGALVALVGAGASFGAIFVGATGPFVATFWSRIKQKKQQLVATHSTCMIVLNVAKVAGFMSLGFVFTDWLGLVILMLFTGHLGTIVAFQMLVSVLGSQVIALI